MDSPDILLVARDDWGNVGLLFERALRKVGVNAMAVKHRPHKFYAGNEAMVLANPEITDLARKAKGILLLHSRAAVEGVDFREKFTVVFHGGSAYRRNPSAVNQIFAPLVQATIVQSGELLGHGAKNEKWIMPPVDTEAIRPAPLSFKGKIQFGHYPSKPEVKGTELINARMAMLERSEDIGQKIEYTSSTERVAWEANLNRMKECDIYIETINPELQGRPFGEWGLTAMEAAALGRVVVSNHLTRELYEGHFGRCAIIPANDADELENAVRTIVKTHKMTLRKWARETRAWVEERHSFEAVGNQLREVFAPCL